MLVRSSKLFGGANYVEKGQFMRVMGPFFTAARKQNKGGDFYGTLDRSTSGLERAVIGGAATRSDDPYLGST